MQGTVCPVMGISLGRTLNSEPKQSVQRSC